MNRKEEWTCTFCGDYFLMEFGLEWFVSYRSLFTPRHDILEQSAVLLFRSVS
jgi:hypothetical protein